MCTFYIYILYHYLREVSLIRLDGGGVKSNYRHVLELSIIKKKKKAVFHEEFQGRS